MSDFKILPPPPLSPYLRDLRDTVCCDDSTADKILSIPKQYTMTSFVPPEADAFVAQVKRNFLRGSNASHSKA